MRFNYPSDGFKIDVEFTNWELKALQEIFKHGYRKCIDKREKAIQKIEDDPNNDGQATYTEKIKELRREIIDILEIVKELKP
jgi:hypothetical protein